MFRQHVWMALLLMAPALPLQAADGRTGRGLTEIPDPELSLMRGRYTVGGNNVAWFGVTMVSQWQASNGTTLQGGLTLGMDFRGGGAPKLSFQPSVHVTAADAPLPDTHGRSIDSSGLANASGLVQSVQVAGDGNVARNVTTLTVREGACRRFFLMAQAMSAHSRTAPARPPFWKATRHACCCRSMARGWCSSGSAMAASARASPLPVTARTPATSYGWSWCATPWAATCR